MTHRGGSRTGLGLLTLVTVGLWLGCAPLQADTLVLKGGSSHVDVQVTEATYQKITFKKQNVRSSQTIDADEVLEIVWTRDGLRRARGSMEAGNYPDVVKRCETGKKHPEARNAANAHFLSASALLAWGRMEPAKLNDAVKELDSFIKTFGPTKDYYLPFAAMMLAEAHTALGKFADAEKALSPLASGTYGKKWVAGGKLGVAEVKLAKEEYGEARSLFGELVGNSTVLGDDDFRGRAYLGYAKSQLGQNQHGPAIQTIQEKVLAKSKKRPPRFDRYAAQGYIVWGRAVEAQAGSDKAKLEWAIIYYIQAIAIAASGSETMAEALYRARGVWMTLGERGNAEELNQRLLKECPSSPWAKKK